MSKIILEPVFSLKVPECKQQGLQFFKRPYKLRKLGMGTDANFLETLIFFQTILTKKKNLSF